MYKSVFLVAAVVFLSGCSTANSSRSTPLHNEMQATTSAKTAANQTDGKSARISQCHKELDALSAFNPQSYSTFKSEFEQVSRKTQKYLSVKANIGDDVNDLAMPHYQFAIRDLCFRIRTELTKSMVERAGS